MISLKAKLQESVWNAFGAENVYGIRSNGKEIDVYMYKMPEAKKLEEFKNEIRANKYEVQEQMELARDFTKKLVIIRFYKSERENPRFQSWDESEPKIYNLLQRNKYGRHENSI